MAENTNKIKEYREIYGISQRKLAEIVDLSPTEINYIENGIHEPGIHAAIRIANALNVTVYEIWEEREKDDGE